jgi:transcription initiation factor TFIIH subunit 1
VWQNFVDEIPEGLYGQMTTCQMAANEFLRQFWMSICPPPPETQTLAVTSPAQRATKAAKMAGYLAKTHEKVDALIRAAQTEGVDPKKIEIVRARTTFVS